MLIIKVVLISNFFMHYLKKNLPNEGIYEVKVF